MEYFPINIYVILNLEILLSLKKERMKKHSKSIALRTNID